MPTPKQVTEAAARIDDFYSNPSEKEDTIEATVQQTPNSQPSQVEDDWKKRFVNYKKATDETIRELRVSLQGYETLQAQVQTLKDENKTMKEQLSKLDNEALELFSEDEVNTFNKLIEAKTSSYKDEITELKSEVSARRQAEAEAASKAAHKELVDTISRAVPEFQTIDTDPRFRKYLEDLNDFGQIRMDLLRQAQANRDVARIVDFYNEFKQLTLATQEPQKQINPKELLQVPRSVNVRPQPTQGVRHWGDADIQKLYRDIALGKIPQQEAHELEKEMLAYVNSHPR